MKIILNNISFTYAVDHILQNISCEFESGNFYSIIGPNGSGKTTLIDIISGFLTPDKGKIDIDNTSISFFSKRQLSKTIAIVSQDYTINFPFRVKDIVMMGRHPYIPRFSHPSNSDMELVETIMDSCDISGLRDRKINELSGGERQRCVFARALCQDTPLLLLDEAFSSMDINHTLHMLQLVKQLVKEKNKLVISVFHDLNLASSWSDSILMLKNGTINAFGISGDVLTPDSIKTVFNVRAYVEFNKKVKAKQVYYPTT